MTKSLSLSALAVLCLALAACASRPPRFYTLNSLAGAQSEAPVSVSVSVGPVSVPGAVNSPLIMINVGPNEIRPDESSHWIAALPDIIGRALVGDLTAALGTSHVMLWSNTAEGSPDYRVSVEVEKFESMPGEAAVFEATWTVRRLQDKAVRHGRTADREVCTDSSVATLAAAHSRAVGRLSQDIAGAIRSMAGS
ncbi:MAG: membrane integrity-associated transporter subunit PqiC [Gammaproteobacteria bacterium]|nr:membrane integrity-associated transporter subunit PqiC [Gammaproteobacteria bacterium]